MGMLNLTYSLCVAQYLFLWPKYFQYSVWCIINLFQYSVCCATSFFFGQNIFNIVCVFFFAEKFSISYVLRNIYLFYGWNIFNIVCIMLYIFWWQKYFQYLFMGWYLFNIVCVAQRTSCWQLSPWAYSCQLPDSLIRISSTNANQQLQTLWHCDIFSCCVVVCKMSEKDKILKN